MGVSPFFVRGPLRPHGAPILIPLGSPVAVRAPRCAPVPNPLENPIGYSRPVERQVVLSHRLGSAVEGDGGSAYGGASVLRKLPENMELISQVHPKGGLFEPAPPRRPSQRGPDRKKGKRLPGMADWAKNRQPWQTLVFDQFGFHATVEVKTIHALYYKAGKDRLLTIVLVRDVLGKRPDQMFYSTCLDWDARQILSTYATRWAIEVTFENVKQLLGFGDPANRKEKAVRRTAPMALVLYSLILVWFHEQGHRYLEFPDRPWYRQKQEPSFADMLTTLRRQSFEEKLQDLLPKTGRLKKAITQILQILSLAG